MLRVSFHVGKTLIKVLHSQAHTVLPFPPSPPCLTPAEPRYHDQELDLNLMLSFPGKPLSNHSASLNLKSLFSEWWFYLHLHRLERTEEGEVPQLGCEPKLWVSTA